MSLESDLYSRLVSLTALPVCQNFIPQDSSQPRVWFQRSHTENDNYFLNGSASLTVAEFSVEVMGRDINSVATAATAIKTLDGYFGTMGSTIILACFAIEQDDDYTYQGFNTQENLNVTAMRLQILT